MSSLPVSPVHHLSPSPWGFLESRVSSVRGLSTVGDAILFKQLRGSRFLGVCGIAAVMGGKFSASASSSSSDNHPMKESAINSKLSEEEWEKRLTKEQYIITRKKGTERAFSGEYWNTKTPGIYECRCCGTPLFDSKTKFDSGTGWPSYHSPIANNVKSETDWSIPFMPRTEVLCANCEAHLGHVFDDGPPPTGKRYCINSASLILKSR